METETGLVPRIKSRLGKKDLFSTFHVRCGIKRYSYTVAPGLYAIGTPDKKSEVLVTANFKLTFDHLRKHLDKINAWILVLDTKGINVWCAAGKGTFSTQELVKRIKLAQLEKIVDHKRIIVPQLGATGVAARQVKKEAGFRVVYGPVRAQDIPKFLENKRKADQQMRMVTFTLKERLILTPIEIQMSLKPALIITIILFILSGVGPEIFSFSSAWQRGMISFFALLTGMIAGAVITPALLPFIPFRHFAAKGIIAGSILGLAMIFLAWASINSMAGYIALFLFTVTISSFMAMNFTGTTPYTSPSGVEKEMKQFIPVQLACLAVSTILWIYSAF
ncbi:MAG: hypothetical protein GY729_09220 [Desulfobacteraceae bacterium]|nr:hypothetical protein [Desulfobacteraceae bacterium]